MTHRCRADEVDQADVNKNANNEGAEIIMTCNRYALLTPFASSTMRTTSDMILFNSKSFGV